MKAGICSRSVALLLGLVSGLSGSAQIDAFWNDYLTNGLSWNPAYTGSHDAVSLGAFYRDQWTAIDGGPSTAMMSIHSPLANASMALGAQLAYDSFGPVEELELTGSYAWRAVTRKGTLSLGIEGSLRNLRQNFDQTDAGSSGDPAFSGASSSVLSGDAGAGAYFYNDRLMAGFSVLDLMGDLQVMTGGALIIPLPQGYKLRPSAFGRYVQDGSWLADAGVHALLFESLWLGGSWRSNGALNFSLEFMLPLEGAFGNNQWGLGYNYQVAGTDWRSQSGSTHEAFLTFRFASDKTREIGPRYF